MKKCLLIRMLTVLAIFTLLLSGCVPEEMNTEFTLINQAKQEEEHAQTLELGEANTLDVENQTGNLIIKKTSGNEVSIKTKIKVDGQVQQEVDKVAQEARTQAEVKGGALKIRVVCTDGSDFWKWKQSNYRMLNVSVSLEVSLPRDLDTYKLRLVTGNITLKDVSGILDSKSTTGNITLDNVALVDNNRIKLTTGNITANVSIANADKLEIENVTGNISVKLPKNSSLTLNGSVATGSIGGNLGSDAIKSVPGANIDKTFGDGKTYVFISLVTGNITVNNQQ